MHSGNVDLQRSASLAFAEITEKGIELSYITIACSGTYVCLDVREVSREAIEPILFLLQSKDTEVQRASSAALGNLAVNRNDINLQSLFSSEWVIFSNAPVALRCTRTSLDRVNRIKGVKAPDRAISVLF